MKKIKIYKVIITFILSFIVHFIYTLFPSILTSIFFPINESIWEHMKIIYTSILLSTIIEYFIYKKKSIKTNNLLISIPITSIICIIIYLIINYLISLIFPHKLLISITLLLIIYIIAELISYKLLNMKEIKYQKIIGIILIILSYLIFTYLTYNPPHNNLFIDSQTNTYGIKENHK